MSYLQLSLQCTLNLVCVFSTHLLPITYQSAIASNVTQAPSIVCNDPPNGDPIQFIPGDYTVSLLTNEHLHVSAINVDSINNILNETHTKLGKNCKTCIYCGMFFNISGLGLRIIKATDLSTINNVLLNEVQFLQECASNPIAILVADELWPNVVSMANEIDYQIWKLPGSHSVLFPKIAHILYQLPWKQTDLAIDIKSDDLELEMAFLEASRREQLCLINDHDGKANVRVALGRAIQTAVDQSKDQSFVTFAVPLYTEDYSLTQSKLFLVTAIGHVLIIIITVWF